MYAGARCREAAGISEEARGLTNLLVSGYNKRREQAEQLRALGESRRLRKVRAPQGRDNG